MITNEKLIVEISEKLSKQKALENISKLLVSEGFATDEKLVLKGFLKREKQISTGLADGIAIPHVASESIKEAKIVVYKLQESIDWKSLDKKPVDLVIAIAVPEKGRNDHFEILTSISAKLIDKDFVEKIKSSSSKDVSDILNKIKIKKEDKKTNNKESSKDSKALNIVGVTTCVTGVAHTFMAAEALEKEAKSRGWNIKVEKQGQMTKDKLTDDEIENADYVIIAKSKNIDAPERFIGKKIYETEVAEPITKAKKVLDDMLEHAEIASSQAKSNVQQTSNNKKRAGAMQHLMTGISYMIPYIAMAGITLGITTAFGFEYVEGVGGTAGAFLPKGPFAAGINALAGAAFTLYIPILGMFIAYSIAGRKAMAPAAILALLLNTGPSTIETAQGTINGFAPFFNWQTLSFSGFEQTPALGFLGAVAAGYLVGYSIHWFTKYTDKVDSQVFQTLLPLLIIPILFTVLPWIFFAFIGYLPLYWLAYGMNELVTLLINNNLLWIAGGILGAMICFDLGGPVNKVAMAIGIAFMGTGINGICALAVSIPASVLFFSWIFHKFTPLEMDENDQTAAASAALMGFFGITEGAIPFAAKDPKKWMPSFMVAGFVGGILMSFTGVVDNVAMWGGPIIYIAGGYGSTMNDLTQQSEWVKTLWYFLPLVISGLVGFGTASGLEWVYAKRSKNEVEA